MKLKVGVSNRHVHLNKEDLEKLFGKGYELSLEFPLTQPGLFAAKEKVTIKSDSNYFEDVRIVGPIRSYTQIEVSRSDANFLGINPPLRNSGDLKGSESITLIGPVGTVFKKEGCIIALRHIHTNNKDILGVKSNVVSLRFKDKVIDNVRVKTNKDFALELHIDKDEALEYGLKNKDYVDFEIGEWYV